MHSRVCNGVVKKKEAFVSDALAVLNKYGLT